MTVAGLVRTVLGDIESTALGVTYAHEHLVLEGPLITAVYPHILLDDSSIAIREVTRCRDAGVATMVDAMPSAGRNVMRLADISRATGMNLIAATGLHHPRYYGPDHWTSRITVDELAELFVADLEIGIDAFDYTGPVVRRTPHRAGLIKVATGGGELSARDSLLFDAAAQAHLRTGAPVLTHCEHGRGALQQVRALTERGVPAPSILLSHIDKVTDIGYHVDIAQAGAWLLFDQALRHASSPDNPTAALIGQLHARGHLRRILLGTDGARRDLWTEYGGAPGLAWLATEFGELTRAEGLTSADVRQVLRDNPARALPLADRRA